MWFLVCFEAQDYHLRKALPISDCRLLIVFHESKLSSKSTTQILTQIGNRQSEILLGASVVMLGESLPSLFVFCFN